MSRIIGEGNTATIYEYKDGKVLKLFKPGYPPEAVQREFDNACLMNALPFDKPLAHALVEQDGRMGIVYDYVVGQTLQEWVLNTKDLAACATYLARSHQRMLENQLDMRSSLPHYKDFISQCLNEAEELAKIEEPSTLTTQELELARRLLTQLPEGDRLCHGDFHPGNVMLAEEEHAEQLHIIDFMNVCRGTRLYDVARTYYLIACTPVPDFMDNPEQLIGFKQELALMYLAEMGISKEDIADYLQVITVARKGECPEE